MLNFTGGLVFNVGCTSESYIKKEKKAGRKSLIRNPTNCSNVCKETLWFSLSCVVYFPQSSGQTPSHQQGMESRKYFVSLAFLSLSQLNYFPKLPGSTRHVALTPLCHTQKSGPFFCMVSSRLTVPFLPGRLAHGTGTGDVQHSTFNPSCWLNCLGFLLLCH